MLCKADGNTIFHSKNLSMIKKPIIALFAVILLFSCSKDDGISKIPTAAKLNPSIDVVGGHLFFKTKNDFAVLFEMPYAERHTLLQSLQKRPDFNSYLENKEEKLMNAATTTTNNNCVVSSSLMEDNADFFSTLDENGVISIGDYYYRVDVCNEKVYVINSGFITQDAWNAFLEGDVSNGQVGWFDTYVDVLQAIEDGYTTTPAIIPEDDAFLNAWPFERWHEEMRLQRDTNSVSNNTRLDGMIAYDKFGIYFHFHAKEKFQRNTNISFFCSPTWITKADGPKDWYVNYNYKCRQKRRNNDLTGNGTLTVQNNSYGGEDKVKKTFYEGWRGLQKLYIRWDVHAIAPYVKISRGTECGRNFIFENYRSLFFNIPFPVSNFQARSGAQYPLLLNDGY